MVSPTTIITHDKDPCIGLPLEETSPFHKDGTITDDTGDDSSSYSSPSPPSPPPPPPRLPVTIPSETQTINQTNSQDALEERVQELEEKLATLSLLLSQRRVLRAVSPPAFTPPPVSPPNGVKNNTGGTTPALESPAPLRPSLSDELGGFNHRRNLSFRVLHGDSPVRPKDDDDDVSIDLFLPQSLHSPSALTAPQTTHDNNPLESLALKTQLLSPIAKTQLPQLPKEIINNSINNNSNMSSQSEHTRQKNEKDNAKTKWLDYLNSFQESNYDTDKQMEEFVKVPSAVEALLSFGFWICVDSFLYILTILPIRFIWSALLLLRYLAMRLFLSEIPEGPYRFHRR
jgi:hypothetical protein